MLALGRFPADMPLMIELTFEFWTEAETNSFGTRLATALKPGDVVCLEGPLGAGKSTLARGLIRALSGAHDIPSPTFTLVETYAVPGGDLWHFDLYRLEKQSDVWELGFEDALESGISIIEWPGKIDGILPDDALRLFIEVQPKAMRRLRLVAPDRWMPALKRCGIT